MKLRHLKILIILYFSFQISLVSAQNISSTENIASASDNLLAFPITDRTVTFNLADSGVYKPINWGLDLAWLSEGNIRRGIAFMGADRIDIVRSSFMPTNPLLNDKLQGEALTNTNLRLDIIRKWLPESTKVALNCDHPSVHSYFKGNAENWAALIDLTTKMHQEAGREVITVSPFNEPDYTYTGQGSNQDFFNIAVELRKNTRFDSIRISGGNTLNCDEALPWYNFLQSQLDEGNTHQLAGGFEAYASFFEAVRTNGHHATNDELHNVMEAMVGVEYGLQTGIWWGTAELARGEFVKASHGKRLGYAEHRENWTAASVYQSPEGKVQAFVGSSERQAASTTYSYLSKDRDVFYDGYGPQRQFAIEMPGGTGYQQGQTNAERVINITWGDDIQPVINGRYILVNRNSGKVMEVAGGSSSAGANVRQATHTGAAYQQWNVIPVSNRIGGDFSYFTITAGNSAKALDEYNWSLDSGDNMAIWEDTKGANQQWFLDYAEDGWFYIRSRHSAHCLNVFNASTANGVNIIHSEKDGGFDQQWRLIPVDSEVEFDAPSAPTDLFATANAESVRLDWTASPEDDVVGYTIFRSESAGGTFNTLARNVKSTAFVDNTCTIEGQYFYTVKAVDKSLNSSPNSAEVEATTTGDPDLVAHYKFNNNTLDSSINLNHGATLGAVTYVEGKADHSAIELNGEDAFVQLPATIGNQTEITISTWVYWNGGTPWQRIFEFGNDETEYINLTPRMRFSISNGGTEQRLNASSLPKEEWSHVAVTLGATYARMYVNGALVDESTDITIRPIDFKPVLNYIGRAFSPVPFFNGSIDDFRIYNYEMSGEEIAELYTDVVTDAAIVSEMRESTLSVFPVPVNDVLRFKFEPDNKLNKAIICLYNVYGKLILQQEIKNSYTGEMNVSDIPGGIYMLKLTNGQEFVSKKIMINH